MKQILVPTDFSTDATKAYRVAADIARKKGFSIHLYHIVKNHLSELSYWLHGIYEVAQVARLNDADKRMAESQLKEHAMNPLFKGLDVKTSISETMDTPVMQVVEEINDHNYELVILGSSKDTQNEHEFSSVLSRYSKLPLLILRDEKEVAQPNNTLVSLDFDGGSEAIINKMKHMEMSTSEKLDLVFINTPADFKTTVQVENRYKEVVNNLGLKMTKLIIHNALDDGEGLAYVMNKWGYDMVGLLSNPKNHLLDWTSENESTEKVIQQSDHSLFILNEGNVDNSYGAKSVEAIRFRKTPAMGQ